MYSIGQFSIMTKIPTKTLRYYDEINLLKPAKVNSENNYRYYDDKSLLLAQQILIYKSCQISLDDIKKLLKHEKKNSSLKEILKSHITVLDEKITNIHKSQSVIHKIIQSLEKNKMNNILLKEKQSQNVLALRKNGNHDVIGEILSRLFETAVKFDLKVIGPHTIIWHEEKKIESDLMDMEIYIPVEKKDNIGSDLYTLKNQQLYCQIDFQGSLSTLSNGYEQIYSFIKEKKLEISGPVEETYYSEGSFLDPFNMKIEIAVPVKETK